jgi:hypothetical protein
MDLFAWKMWLMISGVTSRAFCDPTPHGYRRRVALPLALLVLAGLAAGVLAYGVHPAWAQYPHGFEFILLSRRLQWPLFAVVLILCVALLGMIISGRRRAWWLIGLSPILALLAHRFVLDPSNTFVVNAQPSFVSATQATFLSDDDWVVGLQNEGDPTAYPFFALYPAPLVVQADQFTPMLLMWSPFANRAVAMKIDRSIKAGELEILSMPANTLLVYNARIGQFINGVTGKTTAGQKPAGFVAEIPTIKTTWRQWRELHPQSRVLMPLAKLRAGIAPSGPVLPFYPMPAYAKQIGSSTRPSATRPQVAVIGTSGMSQISEPTVALICTTQPSAVLDADIANGPVNVSNLPLAALLLRDPLTGAVKGFDRQVQGDLFPRFRAKTLKAFPAATLADTDTNSAWTSSATAIDGPLKGEKLHPIAVDDGIYLSVLRVWYPDLPILDPMVLPPEPRPVRINNSAGRRTRGR